MNKPKAQEQTDSETSSLPRRVFLSSACAASGLLALEASPGKLQNGVESDALTPEDRVALALMHFKMGLHCSQSVFEAYATDFGIEPELARRLSAGLAGGSTAGGECGAVGAAYLVLGLRHGNDTAAYGDTRREEKLWGRMKQFIAEFEKRHGCLNCKGLLGLDVFTREGREEALQRNLFTSRCPNYIRDSILILESLG